jgi:hypothetical protein
MTYRISSNKMPTHSGHKTLESAKQACFALAYPYASYISSVVSQIWDTDTDTVVATLTLEYPQSKGQTSKDARWEE